MMESKCLIIAEAGVNHNGDMRLARKLVRAARECGADAIKFQTFSADHLVSKSAPKAVYQKKNGGARESQYAMLTRYRLDPKQHKELRQLCRRTGIRFLSSPFDEPSVDLLCGLGVELFKIPSGEITNFPLLRYIARKGKPVILSTGMSSLGEVEEAVRVLSGGGVRELTLLHCTSNYPADPKDCNLRAMQTLQQSFRLPVGYSDHTPGVALSVAAVALGACVIEKHFTLDKTLPGPDHRASLSPEEFRLLVRSIREVEAGMGDGVKAMTVSEAETRAVARKSLVSACDIAAGTVLREEHITVKRPGTGLPPRQMPWLIGRRVKRNMRADELFDLSSLE